MRQLRHRTIVVHWITGRCDRSLKGWMSTPSGSRAFFSSASVSGILVSVARKMSGLQLMLLHCSACSRAMGGLRGSGGRMCLFCSRSMLSCPHIFWKPVCVTDSPPRRPDKLLTSAWPNLLGAGGWPWPMLLVVD